MKLITERDFIRKEIADFSTPSMGRWSGGAKWEQNMRAQTAAFQALDPATATYEEMDEIRLRTFGGRAGRLTCDECGARVDAVVRFGAEEPDYDASCEDVCLACVSEAARIMRALTGPKAEHDAS